MALSVPSAEQPLIQAATATMPVARSAVRAHAGGAGGVVRVGDGKGNAFCRLANGALCEFTARCIVADAEKMQRAQGEYATHALSDAPQGEARMEVLPTPCAPARAAVLSLTLHFLMQLLVLRCLDAACVFFY